MHKNILITGCQRSGTTLMGLIMDSHPYIENIDEDKFNYDDPSDHFKNSSISAVTLKLPTRSADIYFITRVLKIDHIIWMIRDPRDVITSMANLQMKVTPFVSASWMLTHASVEINRMLMYFPQKILQRFEKQINEYLLISTVPSIMRTEGQNYKIASLCWSLKQCSLGVYHEYGINYIVVKYEDLVSSPEETLRSLFVRLDIDYHEDLLRHHELHDGYSIGNTLNQKKISSRSVGKWKSHLSKHSQSIIGMICSDIASSYGYNLTP